MQTKSLRDLAERLHGIHTETVAEKAGVSTRTVYRIKRGELADASAATVDALNAAIDAMAVEAMRRLKFKPAIPATSAPAPAAAAPETAGLAGNRRADPLAHDDRDDDEDDWTGSNLMGG